METPSRNSEISKSSSPGASNMETPKSRKVEGWLSKFQLPSRFSASVECGLQSKHMSKNVQNEFIRDVYTSIMGYTSYPNKQERVQVAKMIIQKYPCMADKVVLVNSNEWGSLEVKINNRMKKLQKTTRLVQDCVVSESATNPTKPKRRRVAPEDVWSRKPDLPEGETLSSLKDYMEKMKPQLAKKKDVKVHGEYLEHTFALRRRDILENPRPVKDILSEYSSLKNYIHLKGEICRIFANDQLPIEMKEKYEKTWQAKLFQYASRRRDMQKTMREMDAYLSEEDCDSIEIKNKTMFVIINKLLKQTSGKKAGVQDEVFTILRGDSDVDKEIRQFIQPQIVAVGELHDPDQMYIVCEGGIICTIPQRKILDAIIALLGCFYVFNIIYKEGKAILSFLEQSLLGLGRGQTLVSVTSFINDISKSYDV